ncbi:MAG: cytochrome C [Candidatus Dadabacteria bacterium]|nr:MAG: cytochrome C [Candidatus Dadabacteria bacterium]
MLTRRLASIAIVLIVSLALIAAIGSRRAVTPSIDVRQAALSPFGSTGPTAVWQAPGSQTATVPARARTLSDRDRNRAFDGAPPTVPHSVDTEAMDGQACLACHARGSWAPPLNAWAPQTPHPELVYCRQCHVPQDAKGLFRANGFRPAPRVALGNRATPTSPLLIPHELQMRENCVACHAAPATPKAIRTSHPELTSCRQCHVPLHASQQDVAAVFTRELH